jgi:methyltransferase (TIGR00027 family)
VLEAVPSRTAARVARRRAAHQVLDHPVVFEDPLALRIAGITDRQILEADSHEQHPLARLLRAFLAARSRFAEDLIGRAVDGGVCQIVILGAGLDTFAYRQAYGDRVTVFEVDYPATQAWKRQCVANAGIAGPGSLRYVPVDFERQTAFDGLASAGFDVGAPAFFTWLGVTMYLSEATVMSVLSTIATLPPGSGIVFDYATNPATLPDAARRVVDAMAARVAAAGEPWTLFFEPRALARALRRLGFGHIDDLDGDAINARYFAQRADGLRVGSVGHLLHARV